jgi:hypothetical protein
MNWKLLIGFGDVYEREENIRKNALKPCTRRLAFL